MSVNWDVWDAMVDAARPLAERRYRDAFVEMAARLLSGRHRDWEELIDTDPTLVRLAAAFDSWLDERREHFSTGRQAFHPSVDDHFLFPEVFDEGLGDLAIGIAEDWEDDKEAANPADGVKDGAL